MNDLSTRFAPDWVSPPGDTLLDMLEERGWTHAELAERLDYSPKHVSLLINGKVTLSEDAAQRLSSVLGAPVGFWLTREAQYRERLATLGAQARFAAWVDWLDRIPLRELMKCGAVAKRRVDAKAKPGLVADCLAFFGVASPPAWEARYGAMQPQFRRSRKEQSNLGAISAWLRLGEQEAEKLEIMRYDEAAFRQALIDMRALALLQPEEFGLRLQFLFAQAGVVFVMVPALAGSHVSGVARWLSPTRPLIQLSLYGKTNDKFWFTLFHEAAHIVLHGGEKKSVYLDDPGHSSANFDRTNQHEREANEWARDWLIPPHAASELVALKKTRQAVRDFAARHAIHPGVVVGRLQHDALIPISWMNDLKVTCSIAAVSAG